MPTRLFQKGVARLLLCGGAVVLASTSAFATEGGGSAYPGGVENYLTGAAPPPGFHALVYGNVYSADTLRDASGDKLAVPGFKVNAQALSTRLVWSTPFTLPNGNLVLHTILPLVNLEVSVPGTRQSKTGLGDVTVGAGWAQHHSEKLHSVTALDLVLPTGGYNKTDVANIGRNYLTVQPVYTMSWVDPGGFNADFKLTVNLNQRNKDTDYRSGNEAFVDYSAGWAVGQGWTLGLGGYVSRQFSDDEQAGATLDGRRTRALAIGPSLKYDNGKGWFITAKIQQETQVRNRAQGTALWIKTNIPF